MVERRVSLLPVAGKDRRLVGILTQGDLPHRAASGTDGHRRSGFLRFLPGDGRTASDPDLAGGERRQAAQQVERRGLAGAAAAEQHHDLPGERLEAQAVERRPVVVG